MWRARQESGGARELSPSLEEPSDNRKQLQQARAGVCHSPSTPAAAPAEQTVLQEALGTEGPHLLPRSVWTSPHRPRHGGQKSHDTAEQPPHSLPPPRALLQFMETMKHKTRAGGRKGAQGLTLREDLISRSQTLK